MIFKKQRAQSFVEFALILPLLLIMLLGVVEATLFIGSYINVLDLTRTAARFASNRDPYSAPGTQVCAPVSSIKEFDFFYDTSCIFSPLKNTLGCDSAFCDGFNSTLQLKPNEDDVLIYVFTESGLSGTPQIINNAHCDVSTLNGCDPWVWSKRGKDTTGDSNWKKNCGKPSPPPTPNFTPAIMQSYLSSGANMNKGFVVVEVIYCYHQVLNVPIISKFLPNPLKIDTYSVMPLPAAQPELVLPTATPGP